MLTFDAWWAEHGTLILYSIALGADPKEAIRKAWDEGWFAGHADAKATALRVLMEHAESRCQHCNAPIEDGGQYCGTECVEAEGGGA